MIFSLLTSEATPNNTFNPMSLIMMVIVIAVLIIFMVFNRKAQKKKEEEIMQTLNSIKPGNNVKTIGGIIGVVVEVDGDTFVLETGNDKDGKSYIRFDKQAIYKTDAVPEKVEQPAKVEEPATVEEAPVEETPVFEEEVVEAAPVEEKPKKRKSAKKAEKSENTDAE